MYIGSVCVCVCVYTLCSVWGVVAGAPNQALSWQRAALTLHCWLVENIKNMVAGGELVADIKPTFMCHCRQCLRVDSFPQSSQGAWDWAVLGDADSRGSYQGDHCWPIKPTWIKKLLEWRQSEWSEMIESYAEAIKGLCKKIGEIRRINLEAVWGVGLAAMQVHLLYTPHYLHPRPCHPLSQSWSPWSLVGYSATKAWCWIDPGSPREEYMIGLLCRLGKKIKDDKKLNQTVKDLQILRCLFWV